MDAMRELERLIREAVLKGLRESVTADEMQRRVREILREQGFMGTDATALSDQMLRQAAQTFEWIGSRTATIAEQTLTRDLLISAAPQFANVGQKIEQGIVDVVSRGIRDRLSQREIEDQLLHSLRKPKAHARTISNSALQGFGRANIFRQAGEAGITRFRYAGPPGERQFCIEMLGRAAAGRTYTVEEIRALSNGQGLPVQFYCGGYNCRHRWEMVIPELDNGDPSLGSAGAESRGGRAGSTPPKVGARRGISTAPSGILPSSQLHIESGRHAVAARHGVHVIDSVHGVPSMKTIPIREGLVKGTAEYGMYHGVGGHVVRIEIMPGSREEAITTVHEIGHWLDEVALGRKGNFASKSHPVLKEWRDALHDTAAYAICRDMHKRGWFPIERAGKIEESYISDKLTRYLLYPQELFARSYSQYIAMKSGDARLLKELNIIRQARGVPGWQWDEKDFTDLFNVFDRLLLDLGWMMKRP